jgi:tetratricopeptide (TPR) repeat protein
VLALAGLPLASDMKGVPLAKPGGPAPERIATWEKDAITREPIAAASLNEADEELLQNLMSLGYIGGHDPGSTTSSPPAQASVAAPAVQTVTAHTNMASLLAQRGDLAGAEAELRDALSLQPSYFPALMTLGQVMVRQGKVEEALYATRRAVATSPDAEHGAYVQLAMLAARAGQAAEAANFLKALGQRRPEAAGIQTALGVLALSGGDESSADKHYRAALALEPASPEAMGRLFLLYRGKGREAELEPELRRALAMNDRSVLHHNWLGLIRARQGDSPGAERAYRRALELAPDFGGTMANLGSLYGRTGRLEEAVTVLTRALRIEPGNLEARVNLGGALAKLGRLDEAIASLEEARRQGNRTPELLNAIGLAYAQKGLTRQAIEALEESLTLSPLQPAVQSLLSELKQPA